jgi:DUF4097 and DUF4098 domain-containing protein YvlB
MSKEVIPMRRMIFGVTLVPALLLSSCHLDFDLGDMGDTKFREDFHHTYPLKSGGRVEIESFNGSIEIHGWDKETVEIHGTKYAASQELLNLLKVDIANMPDSIRIRSVRPADRRGNMGVKFVLSVPRRTILERVASSNGSVRVAQIEGNGRIKTSNGAVRASNFTGDIDITTSNGAVELDTFAGGATIRTSNGSIKAHGVKGHFEAETSNGSVDAHILEAGSGRPVRVESSNGRILLQIDALNGSDVRASTTNSSLTVKLPSILNARVRASTSNASITSDYELTDKGTISKGRLEGTVGSGGPLIELHSSNGGIRIQKL